MSLDAFLCSHGRWRGTSTLTDPYTGIDDTTDSTATVNPALQEKFVRLTYTWTYAGKAQEGLIMIAHNPKEPACQLYWADTFHNGYSIMTLHGEVDGQKISAVGSYPAPTGPDWGWRIDIECNAALSITMHNISPDGVEEIAVRAEYVRA